MPTVSQFMLDGLFEGWSYYASVYICLSLVGYGCKFGKYALGPD